MKCGIQLKVGQVRSKSRSFDQILENLFLHSKGVKVLIYFVLKVFFLNVYLYESRGSLRLGQVGLSSRSLGQILENLVYTLKGTVLI